MRVKRRAKWDSGERTSTVAQPLNPMPARLSGLGDHRLGTAHRPVERGLELFDRLQPRRGLQPEPSPAKNSEISRKPTDAGDQRTGSE